MRIVYARAVAERDHRGRAIRWNRIAHCVARYAQPDDIATDGTFALEDDVECLFGVGVLLRFHQGGEHLGLVLESNDPEDEDQADLLYFNKLLCSPA